ncbi:class I SAM-dependent methyltransferase [Hyunsoonleella pacifica]|uniref:Methyltransferase domain-containing protein n=1 Tax=Hyunsoonleella pacifica TaxID=1080224 RepID=A0A4Q9FRH8_9FLAO|nr:hypothetical protein [Hyunsoonleella pacifica]TBN18507.1 hypothetical protein EYD46_00115 [Hyunsoonleella pacifica]GGD02380.1 hypothetical protein GCM10011368_00240 [Hyunsoonleella pacifica]
MNQEEYYNNIDRVFRLPRVWSNRELKKIAHLFEGNVVNVSGWKDIDKEGGFYKDYFTSASSYTITNYKREAKGFQGLDNEIFLDLEADLTKELIGKFDTVFNHTVLEHIFEVRKAIKNLCLLTKDIVIVVVPFLQVMHGDYGDYWRFTPVTMEKLFEVNGMKMITCTFNSHRNASVYLFCVASKKPEKWKHITNKNSYYEDPVQSDNGFQNWVGCHAIDNKVYMKSLNKVSIFQKLRKKLKNYVK